MQIWPIFLQFCQFCLFFGRVDGRRGVLASTALILLCGWGCLLGAGLERVELGLECLKLGLPVYVLSPLVTASSVSVLVVL